MATENYRSALKKIHHDVDPYANWNTKEWTGKFQEWGSTHRWFHEIIDELKPEVIVEAGTYLGGSAIHMGKKVKELGLDCVIICIDTWLGSIENWLKNFEQIGLVNGRPTIYNHFISNVIMAGLEKVCLPLPINSLNGARLLNSLGISSSFVYIDSSHEEGDVLMDLNTYYDLVLEPDGILVADDVYGCYPGAGRDWTRFKESRGLIDEHDGAKGRIRKPHARN